MKAVGLYKHLPIEDPQSLVDLDIQQPKDPTGHDLVVVV
jgi:NADPH2:quinone reductase